MTESRNHGTTEGQGESSIAPLFQSGAIIIEHFHFDIESGQKCRSRATLVFDDFCLFSNPDFKDECTSSKDE